MTALPCRSFGALGRVSNADVDKLQARQLPGIGRLLAQRLQAAGAGTLRQLAVLDPRRIETITQRNYPFGACKKVPLEQDRFADCQAAFCQQ